MPLWPQNDQKSVHGLLASRRISFRRQQQSDLHAEQGRASPLMGGGIPTHLCKVPEAPIHPTCMSKFGYLHHHSHARLDGRRPKHESSRFPASRRDPYDSASPEFTGSIRTAWIEHLRSERGAGPTGALTLDSVCLPGISWNVHPVISLLVGLPKDARPVIPRIPRYITASDS